MMRLDKKVSMERLSHLHPNAAGIGAIVRVNNGTLERGHVHWSAGKIRNEDGKVIISPIGENEYTWESPVHSGISDKMSIFYGVHLENGSLIELHSDSWELLGRENSQLRELTIPVTHHQVKGLPQILYNSTHSAYGVPPGGDLIEDLKNWASSISAHLFVIILVAVGAACLVACLCLLRLIKLPRKSRGLPEMIEMRRI
jgi:hypothetical protein